MNIIKLNAIDSTNTYLRQQSIKYLLNDFTVVVAKSQFNGRGQMGTVWDAQADKNLTFSVFKRNEGVTIDHHFYISIVTALAIIKSLQSMQIPRLFVKWPNDILSEQKKVCGILIENVIKNNAIIGSIIGIGLNVNQKSFNNLPQASSLLNITGRVYNLEELLISIVSNMKLYFEQLEKRDIPALKRAYEALLFRKNKPSTFKNVDGDLFSGFIKGIDNSGNLIVLLEDDFLKTFSFKEIQLLY